MDYLVDATVKVAMGDMMCGSTGSSLEIVFGFSVELFGSIQLGFYWLLKSNTVELSTQDYGS